MAVRSQKVLGVSLLTLDVPFHREMKAGLEKAAAEAGFAVKLSVAEFRAADQAISMARLAARQEVDALIVTPCDSAIVGIPVEQANRAGVPVVTIDIANTSGRGKVVTHVASDNLAGGRRAGELMAKELNGKGRVLIVSHPGITSMRDRVRGFKEAIAERGLELAGEVPVWMGQRKACAALVKDLMSRTAVDGVFGGNDEFAMGAVEAVEALGRAGQVKIIGYDGTDEAKAEIRRGRLLGTIVQHPADMAALAVRAVRDHLAGKSLPAFIPAELTVYAAEDARAGR